MKRKFFAALLCLSVAFVLCVNVLSSEAGTKSDIVFFIDSSATMSPYIDEVRQNLNSFASSLVAQSIDVRFAIVQYQYDIGVLAHDLDGSGGVWTSDPAVVESALGTIVSVVGDGVALDALKETAEWSTFRSDASRYGFLLTNDDTRFSYEYIEDYYYDEDSDSYQYEISEEGLAFENGIINELKAAGMSVSVISNPEYRDDFYNIFNSTGGVFVNLNNTNFYESMLDIARWIGEDSTIASADRLPYAVIEAVPLSVLYNIVESGDVEETVLERIARLSNITSKEINVVTNYNIGQYNLSIPHEPTEKMKQEAGGEFIAKLDTITLASDFLSNGTKGYYLFQINVPDELLESGTPINQWKLWYATPDEFTASAAAMFRAAGTGFIDFYIYDQMGMKINNPVKKVLALILGNTGDSLALFILKGVLALLTGVGGCNVGGFAGTGLAGLIAACSVVALRRRFRK